VCELNADYENAVNFLTEAWQEDPQDIAALSMLARMAEKRRKVDEAAVWHRRVLEINPSLLVSNHFLAHLYYAKGEYAAALPYLAQLRSKEPNNRRYNLYWLLASLHVSGVEGLSEHLEDIRTWQGLTPEEQGLAQELFLMAGERSLEEGRARAEQYIRQALRLAPSPRGSSLLAAVDQQKTERAVYKKVFETSVNEGKTADERDVVSLPPPQKDLRPPPQKNLRSGPEKEGAKPQVWRHGVLQRVASRMGGVLASEAKDH
jgi:tetratricopeptide (TPR) repeat protein